MPNDRSVKCRSCGLTLEEDSSFPCSECGSLSRAYELDLEPGAVRVAGFPLFPEYRHPSIRCSPPYLAAYAILALASSVIGAFVVHGWASVGASVVVNVLCLWVGFVALARVIEIFRERL